MDVQIGCNWLGDWNNEKLWGSGEIGVNEGELGDPVVFPCNSGDKRGNHRECCRTPRNISTLRKSQDLTNLARFWVELGTGNVPINLYFMFTGKNCWSIDIELKHIKQGLVEKPSGNWKFWFVENKLGLTSSDYSESSPPPNTLLRDYAGGEVGKFPVNYWSTESLWDNHTDVSTIFTHISIQKLLS